MNDRLNSPDASTFARRIDLLRGEMAREALAAVADHVRFVVPGHGHVGDGLEFRRRVAADLAYLDTLERGEPSGDPRISGWLVAQHERQFAHIRGLAG